MRTAEVTWLYPPFWWIFSFCFPLWSSWRDKAMYQMCACVENIVSNNYALLISNQTRFSSPSVSIKPNQTRLSQPGSATVAWACTSAALPPPLWRCVTQCSLHVSSSLPPISLISTSDPPAGFWGSHQDEGTVPWRDHCPLTSSTRTTTACSRWSSTWACLWGSTSESFFNPDVSAQLLYPHRSAAVVLWIPVWVTRSLSDGMLHYWLIGWLQSQACKFSLHQQNSPFGGGSNLASFHSNQSGTLTMPRIGWLSAQNDWVNSCTLMQYNNWWSNVMQLPQVLFCFY